MTGDQDRAAPAQSAPELPSGTTVDRYVILERVGIDATASIYAAYDPKLDRKVAVKLLTARDDDVRRRFVAEAQSLARLTHPNVVRVHDVGTFENEVFVAREFVRGRSLQRWMRDVPRSFQHICRVFAAAARGLGAAHQAGIVHGGIRPRSVLVSDDGKVRVTDFGVGAAADETAPYEAPEVRRAAPPSPASDQFALCLMLLEALTSRPASEFAPDGIAQPEHIHAAGRKLPRRLLAAIETGLAFEPTERHRSVAPIITVLEPRRPKSWALAACGAMAIVAAAIVWPRDGELYCDDVARHLDGVWDGVQRQSILRAFERADQPYAADAFSAVEQRLDHLARTWVDEQTRACRAEREPVRDRTELARRMYCLDRRLDEMRAVIGVLSEADAQVVQRAVDVVDGVQPGDECETFQQDVPRQDQREAVRKVEAAVSQVMAFDRAGRVADAAALATRTLADAEAIGHEPTIVRAIALQAIIGASQRKDGAIEALHLAFSRALALEDRHAQSDVALSLAGRLTEARRFQDAERWVDHADALQSAIQPGVTQPGPAAIASLRARIANLNGEYAKAVDHYRQAVDLRISVLGSNHPSVAIHRINLGQALVDLGHYEDADREYRTALDLQRTTLGEHHPFVAQTHIGLANLLAMMGRSEEGLEHAKGALAVLESIYGDAHMLVGDAHISVAGTLTGTGQREEGIVELERALAVYRVTEGERSYRAALVHANIAAVRVVLEQTAEADEGYRHAIDVLGEVLGPEHPIVFQVRGNRLGALLALEQWDVVKRETREIIDGLGSVLGKDHPTLSFTYECLAELHAIDGRDDLAVTALERAVALRAGRGDVERAATDLRLAHALRRLNEDLRRADRLEARATRVLDAAGALAEESRLLIGRSEQRIARARGADAPRQAHR